jgi:5-formyltetrahydrofolate cyclo-ligase
MGDYREMLLKSSTLNADETARTKSDFRAASLKRLRAIPPSSIRARSHLINRRLAPLLRALAPRNLLIYMPLSIEPDITPLLRLIRKESGVFVPFMECVSFKLVKYRLPLNKGKFDVKQPQNSVALHPRIDVAIVPVVGVDGDLKRVGFGKGMYDRFFASLGDKPIVIFVQVATCRTRVRFGAAHDVQADLFVTPTDTIIRRGKNNVFRIRNRSMRCGSYRRGGLSGGQKT